MITSISTLIELFENQDKFTDFEEFCDNYYHEKELDQAEKGMEDYYNE